MEITCVSCKQTWQVSAGQLLAARIKFGLGVIDHAFICPNCRARNVVAATEFQSSDHPRPLIPATGANAQSDTQTHPPPRAENEESNIPINPVPGPQANGRAVQAVVLQRGVRLLREHHWSSETMAILRKGEQVTILDSWTNGDDTWVQLGPERWTILEEDDRPLFEIVED